MTLKHYFRLKVYIPSCRLGYICLFMHMVCFIMYTLYIHIRYTSHHSNTSVHMLDGCYMENWNKGTYLLCQLVDRKTYIRMTKYIGTRNFTYREHWMYTKCITYQHLCILGKLEEFYDIFILNRLSCIRYCCYKCCVPIYILFKSFYLFWT